MRSLRWLLLVTMVVIAAAVFGIYRVQRAALQSERRPVPPAIPLDTKTMAPDWEWEQSANGLPAVKVFAKNMTQSADSSRAELQDIELRIYEKDGQHYDRVKSAAAQFTTNDNKLYSPGEAEITLSVPVQGDPPHQLTSITTAGINFDSSSGKAVTDKHVSFTFEQGDGTCTGATYDPATHTLNLNTNVVVNLRGKGGPNSKPMKIEAGSLAWNENAQEMVMIPWSRLTRDQTVIDAAQSMVLLDGHVVKLIVTKNAHGTDQQPGRQVEYAADELRVEYNEDGEMERMTGAGHAKLVAHGSTSQTTMTGDRVGLGFVNNNGDSVLSTAAAQGNGYLESKPLPDPKGETGDTKVLKAESLDLAMKPGGKDLERVNTQTPGTLEFQPAQASRHRRLLNADRMVIEYGAKNEIQSFHATTATTETYPSEEDRKKKKTGLATAYTTSKVIDASFDDNGQMKQMKQTGDFHYTEGGRKAQAETATLQNDSNVMELEKQGRMSDESGSTSADHIQIDQTTGDFDAKGHVSTTRLPETNKNESTMLDKNEPTLGIADRVTSANRNHVIHYSGNAVVWQTSNRIQGDRIDIDRDKKTLIAAGKVVTQFEDSQKAGTPAPAQPTFTIVKAQHMVYTDQDRLASYSGGVDFWRPTLTVKSASLKAYLNEQDSDADSRINHALSDGNVEIVQFAADRQRVGNSEHAEYYTDEGKIVLTGGEPKLNDSKRGNTKGDKLTYFTGDNRLVVEGVPEKKGQTHIRKKS
jgi:lipopolysaccharide export system protein LptA